MSLCIRRKREAATSFLRGSAFLGCMYDILAVSCALHALVEDTKVAALVTYTAAPITHGVPSSIVAKTFNSTIFFSQLFRACFLLQRETFEE